MAQLAEFQLGDGTSIVAEIDYAGAENRYPAAESDCARIAPIAKRTANEDPL